MHAGLFSLKTSVEIESLITAQNRNALHDASADNTRSRGPENPTVSSVTNTGTNTLNAKQPVIVTLLGGEVKLSNGTLGLENMTAMVLNSSCRDVHFSDMTFSGALLYFLP